MENFIATLFLLSVVGTQGQEPHPAPNPAGEEQVRRVIQSLPTGSALRRRLQEGARGDGVHYDWMDEMRREGVKRAMIVVHFVWDGRPKETKVVRTLYFSKYDSDCAQITDPKRLEQIRTSGLEQHLENFAKEGVANSHWFYVDRKPHAKHGVGSVALLDDEWLPHAPPLLTPLAKDQKPLLQAASFGDEASVADLLASGNIDSRARNEALLMAAAFIDDSCLIKLLLKAGADVNTQGNDRNTPLMEAASSGALNNVKALLQAGANVNAEDAAGRTALSLAGSKGYTEIVELLRQASASR